jgi:hypothetical protein
MTTSLIGLGFRLIENLLDIDEGDIDLDLSLSLFDLVLALVSI